MLRLLVRSCTKKEYVESEVHSPGSRSVIAAIAALILSLPLVTTSGAALGLLYKTLCTKELLLSCTKGKGYAAIGTLNGLVLQVHG
jgi:hypothetical protein